ncbi:MAG TPA: DUF4202 domain-containing protein [candidate division Zixibacteria bacterium]|nr:DUF4202 domain-containing protein [candidate division Zixibacteria bacterium]
MDEERFDKAMAQIDEANRQDQVMEEVNGQDYPKELMYGQRMTIWLQRMAPEASEVLKLAVRCQHIQRWKILRQDYPEGRTGYKRWRTDLAKFHAETAAAILYDVGYDDETIQRVQSLVRKEQFKVDPEAQTLEDVACLVFLDHYFAAFSKKYDEEKLVGIVRKTWKKMSDKGRTAALAIALPEGLKAVVGKALG